MTRQEVIEIINDDPHLKVEQGDAILRRLGDCEDYLQQEFKATAKKGIIHVSEIVQIAFMVGYVYASLELNGEVKV